MSISTANPTASVAPAARRSRSPKTSLLAHGQPMKWLTASALVMCLAMIVGLLTLVLAQGASTFWPGPVVEVSTLTGKKYMGEIHVRDTYQPGSHVFDDLPEDQRARATAMVEKNDGVSRRRMLRTGNFEQTGTHFTWVSDFQIDSETSLEWAVVLERQHWGRFYGIPKSFLVDDKQVADNPAAVWAEYEKHHETAREDWQKAHDLNKYEIGNVNRQLDEAKLALVGARLTKDDNKIRQAEEDLARIESWATEERGTINKRVKDLEESYKRYKIVLTTAQGTDVELSLADIVRAYPANRLTLGDKLGIYASRWWEFLSGEPREANSEGGVLPAIWGTVTMTLMMSLAVVPFGVMAALYLREYAKAGLVVSGIRIAVNNLAGVPSIVFGVFGLGFFCYIVGGQMDSWFYEAKLASANKPTFGTGGVLWASLTLALLTLPVVIVATEEALAAVPNSMREGSYACGASKWQTIYRIVLPRAMPGIMTGMILAMARGAGEVAPLMLVGAVKEAPALPVDGVFPYVHLERSFMHLGFHIYDVGFQSQNSEAAKPMVYTTTLLLIAIIAFLNIFAVWLRTRLRRRFVTSQF